MKCVLEERCVTNTSWFSIAGSLEHVHEMFPSLFKFPPHPDMNRQTDNRLFPPLGFVRASASLKHLSALFKKRYLKPLTCRFWQRDAHRISETLFLGKTEDHE